MDVFERSQGTYFFGRYNLDPVRRALFLDGERVKLAERLFDVLFYLVANHGRLVERDELLKAVWAGRVVEDNNVGQAISALRKMLTTGGAEATIVTVPGRGFRFAEPVRFEPSAIGILQDAPWDQEVSRWHRVGPLVLATLALVLASASLGFWVTRAPPQAQLPPRAERSFAPPAHSVAVLAFDNMNDPAQAYLSDGLSEQLIDTLTQIPDMQVAARVSAFSFRGSHADVGQIAHALNVGAALSGSVRHNGNRVVIAAQLTNALTGFNIWSKIYDREQSEIVTVQTDVALAVARAMQLALPEGGRAKLNLGGTSNMAAYDAYLRGMNLRRGAHTATDPRDEESSPCGSHLHLHDIRSCELPTDVGTG